MGRAAGDRGSLVGGGAGDPARQVTPEPSKLLRVGIAISQACKEKCRSCSGFQHFLINVGQGKAFQKPDFNFSISVPFTSSLDLEFSFPPVYFMPYSSHSVLVLPCYEMGTESR